MQPTELLYLKDYRSLSCQARVLAVREEADISEGNVSRRRSGATEDNGRTTVVLDQTIFYPQGGGQPYDTGVIESPSGKFIVEEVRYSEGAVNHIGVFESGAFTDGEEVACTIDKERREFHSRIHSAGHVVDWAVLRLGLPWKPGKGYHFPDGPYVEYESAGEEPDRDAVKDMIEGECNRILAEDYKTKAAFMDKEQMAVICRVVPDNIPTDKPGRIMMFGDSFGVPCGGTHVAALSEVGKMVIRKIKQSGKNIRVGYDIA